MRREIMVQHIGQVTLISFLSRKVTEPNEVESFRAELHAFVDESPNNIFLLDFSAVHFLTSFVIGQLISFSKKVNEINGSVAFCALKPTVREIFSLTNMDKIFPFFPTQTEALEELNAMQQNKNKGFGLF